MCEQAVPEEACGLLGGVARAGRMAVTAYQTENLLHSPYGFRISRRQIERVEETMRARGQHLVGCFHSHPTASAFPSSYDKRHSSRPGFWWVIYSPLHKSVRAFRWDGRRFNSASLSITR